MSDTSTLSAYLNDHRAGAIGALHLIRRMAESADVETPSAFLEDLGDRVEEDLRTLEDVMERLGIGQDTVRAAAGWVGENVSRFRLSPVVTRSNHLSHLLELEMISMGIQGKVMLWQSLQHAVGGDSRLLDVDVATLVDRGRRQFDEVQSHRLPTAAAALTT